MTWLAIVDDFGEMVLSNAIARYQKNIYWFGDKPANHF